VLTNAIMPMAPKSTVAKYSPTCRPRSKSENDRQAVDDQRPAEKVALRAELLTQRNQRRDQTNHGNQSDRAVASLALGSSHAGQIQRQGNKRSDHENRLGSEGVEQIRVVHGPVIPIRKSSTFG
jgi:hypothetical protein